jgi:hypothetical protein
VAVRVSRPQTVLAPCRARPSRSVSSPLGVSFRFRSVATGCRTVGAEAFARSGRASGRPGYPALAAAPSTPDQQSRGPTAGRGAAGPPAGQWHRPARPPPLDQFPLPRPAAPGSVRSANRKPENPSPWAASRPKPAGRLPDPCQPAGPRPRLGGLTGRAVVARCCPASSGSWLTTGRRRSPNTPEPAHPAVDLAWGGQVGKGVSPVLTDRGVARPLARSPEQGPDQRTGEDLGVGAGWGWSRAARDGPKTSAPGIVDPPEDVDKHVGQWHPRKGPPWQEVAVHSFSAKGGSCWSSHPESLA